MSFTAITSTEIEAGKPVKESLFTKVKDNFDDHESRITANAVSLENKYGSSFFNLGASYSAASDALTITAKQQDGSTDPTSGSPAIVAIRSATATSATYALVNIESGINLTIPKGATLGGTNAVLQRYYLYVLSNAGTPELAVSGAEFHESDVVTTVAISAASDVQTSIYSNSARTNVPITPIGFFEATTSVSGDWVAPSKVFTGNPQDQSDMGAFSGESVDDNQTLRNTLYDINDALPENTTRYDAAGTSSGGSAAWVTLDTFDIFSPTGMVLFSYDISLQGSLGVFATYFRVTVGGTEAFSHDKSTTGSEIFKTLASIDKGSKGTYTVNIQARGLISSAYTYIVDYHKVAAWGY